MSQQPPSYPPPGGCQYIQPSSENARKTKVLNLDQNVGALLCYLPICCINLIFSIIWLATEPRPGKFLRFHALQSLLLFGTWLVAVIVFWFLGIGMIFSSSGVAETGGGFLLGLGQLVVYGGFLVLDIICLVKAYQYQLWKIPIIGSIADKNS